MDEDKIEFSLGYDGDTSDPEVAAWLKQVAEIVAKEMNDPVHRAKMESRFYPLGVFIPWGPDTKFVAK